MDSKRAEPFYQLRPFKDNMDPINLLEFILFHYRHNPPALAIPWLLFIPAIPLWHPAEGANVFLRSGKPRVGSLPA